MPSNPLLRKKRRTKRPSTPRAPVLDLPRIRTWIGEYHDRTGEWPKRGCGVIPGSLGETWYKVDKALRYGTRGLRGDSSLAKLLEAEFNVRNIANLPPLSIEMILQWLDAEHVATGEWPGKDSGPVLGQRGETWMNIDAALRQGLRGLKDGSSLARLLAEHRDVVNPADRPLLNEEEITAWAVRHYRDKGVYPTRDSGPIPQSEGDTWMAIDAALHRGSRGLQGESSLADLLARKCGVRNRAEPPPLTEDLIVIWARGDYKITGQWPRVKSGPVLSASGETWGAINKSLREGQRGLPPNGPSLAKLLWLRLGVRNNWHLPELTEDLIWSWMNAKHGRDGSWPTRGSGVVKEAPEETWKKLDAVLRKGRRGLPGGSSLHRLRASRLPAKAQHLE